MVQAICLQGMDRAEIAHWTRAMIDSGETMSFEGLGAPTTDKHSTGGVGDKITLPLAPLVASFGAAVPQLSGRGLGHTGGTLDKLESIPGWRADLTNEEFFAQLREVGAVICAAGSGLAPADELARTMVDLGTDAGVRTVALLTDMSAPLGLTAGNAIEVEESLEVLQGGGPADVVELTVALAREMLAAAGKSDVDVEAALQDGRAMDTWRAMITAQGGDVDAPLPQAAEFTDVVAEADGVITDIDSLKVGVAAWRLGAGRSTPGAPVQHEAGVRLMRTLGQRVTKGEVIARMQTNTPEKFSRAEEAIAGAFTIDAGAEEFPLPSRILDRIA